MIYFALGSTLLEGKGFVHLMKPSIILLLKDIFPSQFFVFTLCRLVLSTLTLKIYILIQLSRFRIIVRSPLLLARL